MPRRTHRYKTQKSRKTKSARKIRKGGSHPPIPPYTEKELLTNLLDIINYNLGYFSVRIKTEDLYRIQPLSEMSHLTMALIKSNGIDYTHEELSKYIAEMKVQLEIWKIYTSNYEGEIKQEMDNRTVLMKTIVSMLQPDVPEIHPPHLLRSQSSDPMSRQSSMGSRQNSVPDFSAEGSDSIEMNTVNTPLFKEGRQHLRKSKEKMKEVYDFLKEQRKLNGQSKDYVPILRLLHLSINSLIYLLNKMKNTHAFKKGDSMVYTGSYLDLLNAMDQVNDLIGVDATLQNMGTILTEAVDDMIQANVLLPGPPSPRQATVPSWPPPVPSRNSLNSRQSATPNRAPSPVTNGKNTNSNQEGRYILSKNQNLPS